MLCLIIITMLKVDTLIAVQHHFNILKNSFQNSTTILQINI